MIEEQKTCQVKVYDSKPCGRPVWFDDCCICHSEDPEKDVHLFQKEIDEQQARTDLHDFTSFVFPKNFSFMNPEFPKNAYFIHAQFSGDVFFAYIKFCEDAYFNSAQFSGDVFFAYIKFSEDAYFNSAQFSGVADFKSAQFSERAYFNRANFSGEANFYKALFSGEAIFIDAQFFGKAIFKFAKFSGEAIFIEAKFSGEVVFYDTRFSGEAMLHNAKFSEEVDFSFAKFYGETTFTGAEFSGKANFWKATFSNLAWFERCGFCREAHFRGCVLTEKAQVWFDNEDGKQATFQSGADFRSLVMFEGTTLTFRKIDIETCRFLETDLRRVQFIDVKFPPTRHLFSWFVPPRSCVFDELDPDSKWIEWCNDKEGSDEPACYQYSLIAQLYRHLQTNFMESNRYSEAGDFHIGEQEMRRKDKGPLRRFFCTNVLYKLISNYGESFGRPLAWLLLVLLLFPAIILWGGINPSAASDAASGLPESISYSFSLNPADCFLFQGLDGDYWTVFFKNISFLTFSREKLSAILLSPLQDALAGLQIPVIVTLIAFFLLALRRQFKRKSF